MANRRPAPINIACVIHDLDRGGAQRILGGLLNRIVDRSIQRFPDHPVRPHLITLADGSQDAFSLDTSIPRTDLDVMGDSRGWLDAVLGNRIRIRALARTLREIRPDVVLSFCDRTNVTALLAAAKQYPVIISEHSDPTRHPIGRFWGWLRRKYYPRAASIIALTDTSAGYLQRIGKQAPVVIPGAIEVPAEYEVCAEYEAHDPSSRSSEERFTWCAVGRLSAEKNFAAFVDAFSQIARRFA
ncbi:MAG: glycosyltransferase, partial [Planctomycetota bacterium]